MWFVVVACMVVSAGPVFAAACPSDTIGTWTAPHGGWGWETAFHPLVFYSLPGSELTLVGRITDTGGCGPLGGLQVAGPDSEVTWVLSGMISQGSSDSLLHGASRTTTYYIGGSIGLYTGYGNAPYAMSMPPDPPNSSVPAKFEDGELLYQGQVGRLSVFLSITRDGYLRGYFSADFVATGGPIAQALPVGHIEGRWCFPYHGLGCAGWVNDVPQGYTGFSEEGFIAGGESVDVKSVTWGRVKILYRK